MNTTDTISLSFNPTATVYRCTCKQPETHAGAVCPKARRIELGNVKTWHLRHPILFFKSLILKHL